MVHAYLKQTEISLLHALITVVILSKSTIEKLVHSVESRMVKVMVKSFEKSGPSIGKKYQNKKCFFHFTLCQFDLCHM